MNHTRLLIRKMVLGPANLQPRTFLLKQSSRLPYCRSLTPFSRSDQFDMAPGKCYAMDEMRDHSRQQGSVPSLYGSTITAELTPPA